MWINVSRVKMWIILSVKNVDYFESEWTHGSGLNHISMYDVYLYIL